MYLHKFLSLCSLRTVAVNHLPIQVDPNPAKPEPKGDIRGTRWPPCGGRSIQALFAARKPMRLLENRILQKKN